MTRPPELRNRLEVARALEQHYPPMLRDAGIGGRSTVSLHLNADGAVEEVRLTKSSGHQAMDEAALRVARIMQFRPAMNREERVVAWIELPIIFTAR